MTRENRPNIVGDDTPTEPYPLRVNSTIIAGFGRGSSDLGFPTANIPQQAMHSLGVTDTGIYYGYARVCNNQEEKLPQLDTESRRQVEYNYGANMLPQDDQVFPMVMSIGWNPFYNNKQKSAEVYIIHDFKSQLFYGANIKLLVLGYIRPELDYISKEALIKDIDTDVEVTLNSLDRPGYRKYRNDSFFLP